MAFKVYVMLLISILLDIIVPTLHPEADNLWCASWRMHEYDSSYRILHDILEIPFLRLFSPDTVSTLPAILPGLHASNLSGRPTSRSTRSGKGHSGGI